MKGRWLLISSCLLFILLYFAKNIEISVTDASATTDSNHSTGAQVISDNEISSDPQEERQQLSQLQKEEVHNENLISYLAELLREQKLCEFIEVSNRNKLGKYEQWLALEKSFEDPEIQELTVFLEADYENVMAYETEAARFYLFGQNVGAFKRVAETDSLNFEEGLDQEDKKHWDQVLATQSLDSQNLLYVMAKHNILRKYSNRSSDVDEEIFNELMSADHFVNPLYELQKKIYNKSKDNVAQFVVAQDLLLQEFTLDRNFSLSLIWYYYSEETRSHVNQVMKTYLDNNNDSYKVFGYEPNLFELYRYSSHADQFLNMPTKEDYESSRSQPVFSLAELQMDLTQGCNFDEIEELAIKLRSL